MKAPNPFDVGTDALPHTEVSCERCSIRGLCLPGDDGDEEYRAALNGIVQRARPLRRGALLFRAGETVDSIYALRSGALKCWRITPEGNEHITGFSLPGDVVGLESLFHGVHAQSAIALDTSLICRIPLARYEKLAAQMPAMHSKLLHVVSRELHDTQDRLADARHTGAPASLAGFLLSLSRRQAQRGLRADAFVLPMSRGDIANYLGLTQETVSRALTRIQSQGLVKLDGRTVQIVAMDELAQLARSGLHAWPATE